MDTRHDILKAATTLFAERGFDGTSVRDIVKAAGVNVSLVSYHFGGKDALYRECLKAAGVSRLAIAEGILSEPTSRDDLRNKLERFVAASLDGMAEDLGGQRLVATELDSGHDRFGDLLKDVFLKVHETAADFLRAAQARGLMRRDLEPMILASMLRGLIINETRLERVKNKLFKVSIKDADHRRECGRHIAGLFLDGICAAAGMVGGSQSD